VAEYRWTGMDTSPKATVPFHIDRITITAPPNPLQHPDHGYSPYDRRYAASQVSGSANFALYGVRR
jgi:hypothetical protein